MELRWVDGVDLITDGASWENIRVAGRLVFNLGDS